VNPDQLLRHFERISEAPDATKRLRQFILQLAVRGKLLEQKPGTESARELLHLIQRKRTHLLKEAEGVRTSKPLPPVTDDDQPFSIPPNWVWTRLGEIGDWGSGSTPPRGSEGLYGGSVAWVKSGELDDNPALADSEETITDLAVRTGSFRQNQRGDVLIAMYGATIGKVAILAKSAVTNQAVCGCSPFSGVSNRYLFQFLISQRERFHASSEGGAQPNISKVKLVKFPFPLPPLDEQHCIVAKVDELMALCDRLEAAQAERERQRDRVVVASLQRLNQLSDHVELFGDHARFHLWHLSRFTTRTKHVQQLRRLVLNLAIRGQFVLQDRADEPAAILLERLAADAKAYCLQHGIAPSRPDPIDAEDQPHPVPLGWMWTRLSALFRVITDGDHQPPPKSEHGVPFLTIGNITTGRLDFSDCRFVSPDYFQALAEYRKPSRGDILYTVVGATYGRPALVNTDRAFCVQRHIAILKPTREIDVRFLYYLLASPWVYEQAKSSVTGTAQPTIPLRPLRNFLVAVPPLAEQHRIVAKVNELMAICDRLEAQLSAAQAVRGRLLEAVLQEALEDHASAESRSMVAR
jgi:type I restriction enzyme, S subunit